jgi:hypothetical protein
MRSKSLKILNVIMAVAGLTGFATAAAMERITILNGTNCAIVAMQVRPSGVTNMPWIPLSPGRPIGIQGMVSFEFALTNCRFDVQAQFADGRSMNKVSQPFCQLPRATYIIRAY